jgi:hypothetical protein
MIYVGCRLASRLSLKAVIDAPIRYRFQVLNTADGWHPAINPAAPREAPGVAGRTELVDLPKWPTGTRLIR